MITIAPLVLTRERVTRLLSYIQEYRRLVLTRVAPSQERNARQRLLQALQGKLLHDLEQAESPGARYHLALSGDEQAALHAMVSDLRARAVQEPASSQRDRVLVDLTALKQVIEKLPYYDLKKQYTQNLF